MRPKHRYLGGNKGNEAPTSFLFFDSETSAQTTTGNPKDQDLSLRLWCAVYVRRDGKVWNRRQTYRGHTATEFWDVVRACSHKDRPLWAFAHNLGVDLTWLRFWQDQLEPGHYTIGPVERGFDSNGRKRRPWKGRLCLEGRPTFAFTRNKTGVVKFIDTGNYWPTRLYDIGEAHGLPKGTMPTDVSDELALTLYCMRDCEVIEVAVKRLVDNWLAEKCGVFRPTAPGLAMQNFKHTMTKRAKAGECTAIVLNDERPSVDCERGAYYGGRIEPFYVGPINEPVYLFDCVSQYPAQMREHPFPVAWVETLTNPKVSDVARRLPVYGAVARVRIDARGNTYPVRTFGHQLHATGQFLTYLCGPELVRAVRSGDVKEVLEAHFYTVDYIFRDWVDTWWNRRLKAMRGGPKAVGELELTKLILNSLSGKFGQKGMGWFDRHGEVAPDAWCRWVAPDRESGQMARWRSVGWNVQCRLPSFEPAEAFPAIAAFITSHARESMRDIFAKLPMNSLYYSATDSLLVNRDGFDALMATGLVDDERLGGFAFKRFARSAQVNGPNWWSMGRHVVRAGLHAKATRDTNGVWKTVLWHQLATILSARPDGIVRLREVTLDPPRTNQKGDVHPTGWVFPKSFWEGQGIGSSPPKYTKMPSDSPQPPPVPWPVL